MIDYISTLESSRTTTIGNVGTDADTSSLLIFDIIMSGSPSYY